MLAIKTLRLVNTEYLAAFSASPPFFFVFDKMPYAKILDMIEVVDHAHAVLGSIPLIQMLQPGAGEAVTAKAVPDFSVHDLLTFFDSACDAGF